MPNRLLREGILTPDPATLRTVEDVLAVRASLPRVNAGHPLQAYKWALAMRLRAIRKKHAGALAQSDVAKMIRAAGDICQVCGNAMGHGAKRTPSIDHIVPLAAGGTNDAANLRVICNRCNSRKSNRA